MSMVRRLKGQYNGDIHMLATNLTKPRNGELRNKPEGNRRVVAETV